ncbi:hypothetical protein ACLESO_29380 [Pyxidicoccus sp. 3LG]
MGAQHSEEKDPSGARESAGEPVLVDFGAGDFAGAPCLHALAFHRDGREVPVLVIRAPLAPRSDEPGVMFRASALMGMAMGLVLAVLVSLDWRPSEMLSAMTGALVGVSLVGPEAVAPSAAPPPEADVPEPSYRPR